MVNTTHIANPDDGRVFRANDGHYFIIGKDAVPQVTLQKVDAFGTVLWSRSYALPDVAELSPQRITEAVNGDLLIAGSRDLLSDPQPSNDLFFDPYPGGWHSYIFQNLFDHQCQPGSVSGSTYKD